MKKFFLLLISLLISSTSLFADYKLEPVQCTEKKKSNCGAYLYNTKTGSTYFCNSEKCEEVMPAIEVGTEVLEDSEKSKKSKIPKKPKKEKKSKIPKMKKATE